MAPSDVSEWAWMGGGIVRKQRATGFYGKSHQSIKMIAAL